MLLGTCGNLIIPGADIPWKNSSTESEKPLIYSRKKRNSLLVRLCPGINHQTTGSIKGIMKQMSDSLKHKFHSAGAFIEAAKKNSSSAAILAPDRKPLSYGRLCRHIDHVVSLLNDYGIGRNDRIAIVLPDGPEMAVAFLSVVACATCAPL